MKIELLALAINLPLESLALCMSFLFLFFYFLKSWANNSLSDLPGHTRCKKRAYLRNY